MLLEVTHPPEPVVDWLLFLAIGGCVCCVVAAIGYICDLVLYWRRY